MQLQRKVDKKRELLISQQKTELQVLQGKLENSLHEKLRVRSKEIKKFILVTIISKSQKVATEIC